MDYKIIEQNNEAYLSCENTLIRLGNQLHYISNGGWFRKGASCTLDRGENTEDANCGSMGGIFIGERVIETPHESRVYNKPIGSIRIDSELCQWEEFDIYDANMHLLKKAILE
jgi:hypothetical protein